MAERVFPEVIVWEGRLGQSSSCLVSDHHILHETLPWHVGVTGELRHEPLVLDRLEPMAPHVATEADDQLGEIVSIVHDEHVRA